MYKKTLAVASFALCAAMPFAANAQSSTAVRGYCAMKVSAGLILADRETERGISECHDAAFEMQADYNYPFQYWDHWKLGPVVEDMINIYICLNRELSGGYGRDCEQFMESLDN